MDKFKMETKDLTQENIEKIGQLFPNVITEMKDENGNLKKGINFELLKQELSKDIVEHNEHFEFTWIGKMASIVEANTPIRKTLRPAFEESKNWETTENIYIEGDNLDVLKLLQESYLGKIKMIYIDPPYNTGNDCFVYPDNFAMDEEEYQERIEYKDEEGNINFHQNNESNPRFHSDWCSMMYPRLKLAHSLLSEDGVIFISIDDNEVANLRKICDEIFGESHFLTDFIWRKKGTSTNVQNALVSALTDHILCYSKGAELCLNRRKTSVSDRSYPLSDSEGNYRTTIIEKKDAGVYARETMKFPILGIKPREGKRWQIGEKTAHEYESRNRFIIDNGIIKLKIYDFEDGDTFSANANLLLEHGTTDSASKNVNVVIFDTPELFSNPKPIELLKHLIELGTNPGDIILDFFSGSATTAHAVMQLNAEDGGNRKFIMVQLPEACPEDSEAFKAGYKNIAEIGKERIRRAGEKIKNEIEEENNKDLLLEEKKKVPDIGFRVFKVDSTNMKDVFYSANEYTQEKLVGLESNIKEDRTDLDLLYGVLLEWGLPLSLPHQMEKIEGVTIHIVDQNALIACFADHVPEQVIREIAKRLPLRVVFRDSCFASSPEKINIEEIFKLLSPNTSVKVL